MTDIITLKEAIRLDPLSALEDAELCPDGYKEVLGRGDNPKFDAYTGVFSTDTMAQKLYFLQRDRRIRLNRKLVYVTVFRPYISRIHEEIIAQREWENTVLKAERRWGKS